MHSLEERLLPPSDGGRGARRVIPLNKEGGRGPSYSPGRDCSHTGCWEKADWIDAGEAYMVWWAN